MFFPQGDTHRTGKIIVLCVLVVLFFEDSETGGFILEVHNLLNHVQ
jgi:hypothetical protein